MGAPVGNQFAVNAAEWRQALRRAMAHKAEGDYRQTLFKIAETVVGKALEGDKDAWKEIAEREDGKTAQAIQIGNEPGKAFKLERIERVIIDPAHPDA